jgi:hypothetical protein
VSANWRGIPTRAGKFDEAGLNSALDQVRRDPARARLIAKLLQENPRAIALKLFDLTEEQHETLDEMTDEELREFATPVVEALNRPDLGRMRIAIRRGGETNSTGPTTRMRAKKTLEIEW